MEKREFELSKLLAKTRTIESFIGLGRLALICLTLLFAIHLILEGIKPLIGEDASQIEALAKFVQSFKLGTLISYGIAGGATVAWAAERRGKQRAIREKARYQGLLEKNEPNRSSSGLTEIGQTPK